MLTKECKDQIVKKFKRSDKDTGSCEVQIAIITERINQISSHLQTFPKDHHSHRGLMRLVARRKAFYAYLKRSNPERYNFLIENLKQDKSR